MRIYHATGAAFVKAKPAHGKCADRVHYPVRAAPIPLPGLNECSGRLIVTATVTIR